MNIKILNSDTPEVLKLAENLTQDIEAQFGAREPECMNLILNGPEGQLLGGIRAHVHWGWVYITQVWIDKNQRNKGYLRQLMNELIKEAEKRGFTGLYIDTFDIKVSEIYEKLGFQRFGEIPNFPAGNSARIYLYKRISQNPKPSCFT